MKNLKTLKESVVTESKGAKNYFEDLTYYFEKSFRYLDAGEKKEYIKLVKNFFSKI
jgi:hypothetical protein|tara:strand:+ start:899 stop:1066 length:168 start_codon:yes stop_codon:yes gene_type:complete